MRNAADPPPGRNRCKFGAKCRNVPNKGECKDWHPLEEYRELRKQFREKHPEARLQKLRQDAQLLLILPVLAVLALKQGGLDPQRVREDEGTARRAGVPLLEIMVPLLRLDIDLKDLNHQK